MKQTILLLAALCCTGALHAQQTGRIYRTEVIPYDTRHDAEARNRAGVEAYREFKPRMLVSEGEVLIAGQSLEIPYAWTDGNVYLHIENAGRPYRLTLNGEEVALCADPVTPAEYALTPYIREGENSLLLELDNTGRSAINPEATPREPLPGATSTCRTSARFATSPSRSNPTPRGATSACCGSTSWHRTPTTTTSR